MEHQLQPPNFDPARGRLLEFVTRNCALEVIDPGEPSTVPKTRAFVPRDLLQTYLESHHHWELKAIIEGLNCGPINPGHIMPRYTAVFCTLLHSGRGSWIKHFTRHGSLEDTALPFDPRSPPRNWPQAPGDPKFLDEFCKDQWRFCAPTLTDPVSNQCFEDERPLPITFKKKLRDGGSAILWLINIHPSYNKLISEDQKQRVGKEHANTFVLKEYSTTDAQKYYDNETSAFDQIGKHPHIISYFGSFTRSGTFNVILEYADKGTLKEYFEKQLPPSSGEEIIKFWEGLFQLIDALWRIHTVNGDAIEGPQIFRGWHQDVKPENILVLSNGSRNPQDWLFKLADLGISHFKRGDSLRGNSTASDTYGTHTYGAPETSRPDENTARNKLRVHQNIDIWSLGCIYSEAVRWMAENKLGVINYRKERETELGQIHPVGKFDCFHNDYEALEAVRRSHQTALNRIRSLRRADFITEKVVDMIGDMLVETKHRPTAESLWRKQRTIVDFARKNLQEFRKSLQIAGSELHPSDRDKLRSVTHPVPGPSSNSEPAIPPVVPPEYRQKVSALGPTGCPVLPAVHENSAQYGLVNGASEYDAPRHHSPDIMDHEIESPGFTPVQKMTPAGVLQTSLPLTPPFSPKPRYPPQGLSTDSGDDPFTGHMQHDATALPYRSPRGASNVSNTPTGMYSTPSSGIDRSSTGSLGRNDRQTRFGPGVNGDGSPINSRPLTTIGLYSELSSDNTPQRETSHSSSIHRPHTQVNDQADVDDHRLSTGRPIRQSTVTLEPQIHQNQDSTHRPPLQTAISTDSISLNDVLDWKRKCKSDRTYKPFLNKRYQDRMKGRDHVFLVDDSSSMVKHWPDVTKVIEGLSYILKDADKDGLDLYFTISAQSTLQEKHTSSLVRLVERHKQRDPDANTEINFRLNQILDRYKAKLDNNGWWSKKPPKPLSLYILTNGVWEAECKPEIPIKNVVQKLQDLRKDREQIGIQFISFGNDKIGMERLRHLDDDLTKDLNLDHDIVDTTPWDDNVCKMLLGHLNENMDQQRPNTASYGSPTSSALG
ncbi:hypothetical protein BKA65DRAFT_517427 [Rhexocercosporidium sp. MPI-PUGE-AT-0058]|nr:hypothetical protein BKA65DRAFT_517427 [Rhexocercosporidium sp. MPI-PUGE-AT-0058]